MKYVFLLGGTGSIGTQTLDIIRDNPQDFKLIGFSFHQNLEKALAIIDEFKPLIVVNNNVEILKKIDRNIKKATDCFSFLELEGYQFTKENTLIMNAVSGVNGLIYSDEILNHGFDLYLANKESLVCAGEILINKAQENGLKIIPIDSEHTSLLDLICNNKKEKIVKYIITASGGAFRDLDISCLKDVTKEQALNHPNWLMGPKITIDSDTMMNKVFELVEASYLYDTKNIGCLMDKASKIHAIIQFKDGSYLPHLSNNDMHLPIKYAMYYPSIKSYNQEQNKYNYQDLIDTYHLEPIDYRRFPVLKLVDDILTKNSFSGMIITTINDFFVHAFLNNQISFLDITTNLFKYYEKYKNSFVHLEFNIKNILNVQKSIERSLNEICGK